MNFRKIKDNANYNFIFNFMASFVQQGALFFTMPLFVHLIGVEGFGFVSIYLAYCQIVSVVISMQLSGSIGTSRIHFEQVEAKEYDKTIIALMTVVFFVMLIVCTIIDSKLSKLLDVDKIIIYLIVTNSYAMGIYGYLNNKFVFEKQSINCFLMAVAFSLLSICLSVFFIVEKLYSPIYYGRIVGIVVSYVFVISFSIFIIFDFKKIKKHLEYIKYALSFSLPLIFNGLAQIIMVNIDKIMLKNLLENLYVVGVYSVIVNIVHAVNVLWNIFNNTWVPYFYDDLKKSNIISIKKKSYNYLILFTSLVTCFYYMLPEIFCVFGKDFDSCDNVVMTLLFLSSYMVFFYSFPVNVEFYNKSTKSITCGTVLACLINILLNYHLIPSIGVRGAAFSTFISYFLLFLFHHYIATVYFKK